MSMYANPADMLEAVLAENEELKADAARYRWLKARLIEADLWQSEWESPVLVFEWPKDQLKALRNG